MYALRPQSAHVSTKRRTGDSPPSASSITRIATTSSPSSTSSDINQSSASSPDSSAETATAKTRVFRDRLYPSLLACSRIPFSAGIHRSHSNAASQKLTESADSPRKYKRTTPPGPPRTPQTRPSAYISHPPDHYYSSVSEGNPSTLPIRVWVDRELEAG